MHRKVHMPPYFPKVSFAADYNRTLKKQVMYMDGFDMGSTENTRHGRHAKYG